MPLTDAKIRNTKPAEKPIRLSDGGWLYLEIRPSGAKLWRFRYRIAGKENIYAIGEYPHLGLADARSAREEARELVKQGIHPAHHRKAQDLITVRDNANTFEAVAREWIGQKKPGWTADYLRQVERFMESDVFPHIGALPVRSVTAAHLLEIIKRGEGRGAEIGRAHV